VKDEVNDTAFLTGKLATLWMNGVDIDWRKYYAHKGRRKRISLPTYSFEKVRHLTEVDPFGKWRTAGQKGWEMEHLDDRVVVAPHHQEVDTSALAARPAVQTSTEKILLDIYTEFFGFNEISTDDSFAELGGDSLRAMVLLKRIRQQFDINITLKEFFDCKNIRELSHEIEETKLLMQKTGGKSKMII
jgi:acyl carrier protein